MKLRVFLAGDSTVAANDILTYPQTGLGQALRLYLKSDVEICNYAVNGRSTKSFLDEFRLAEIYDNIKKGDYLFIQFGHNDEKKEDPERYTEPWNGFCKNLECFICAARNKKAKPVLITPLYRRCYSDAGELIAGDHLDYAKAMAETGRRLGVPVIDLCSKSEVLLREASPIVTREWYMNLEPGKYVSWPEGKEDQTHLTDRGAVVFAGLLAEGLKKLGGAISDEIVTMESRS